MQSSCIAENSLSLITFVICFFFSSQRQRRPDQGQLIIPSSNLFTSIVLCLALLFSFILCPINKTNLHCYYSVNNHLHIQSAKLISCSDDQIKITSNAKSNYYYILLKYTKKVFYIQTTSNNKVAILSH